MEGLNKEGIKYAHSYMQFSKKIALIGILGSLILALIGIFIILFEVKEIYLDSIKEIIGIYTTLGTAAVLGYMGNSGFEKFVRGKYGEEIYYGSSFVKKTKYDVEDNENE